MIILPPDAMERSVARLMERLRNGKGWKHREAARELGISRSGVTKMEGGGRHVRLTQVPLICVAYGLTEPEFMTEWLKDRRHEARLMEEFKRRRLRF